MNENETCPFWDCTYFEDTECIQDCLSCDVFLAQSCENCSHFGVCPLCVWERGDND